MKFHETHFDEYVAKVEEYNFHPELVSSYDNDPSTDIGQMGNMIIYGPSGVGKYSQMLRSIKKYSPSGLKYDKNMVMHISGLSGWVTFLTCMMSSTQKLLFHPSKLY